MTTKQFNKHKKEILSFLPKISDLLNIHDFIVIGSSVLILNDININRKVSDIDILVFRPYRDDSYRYFEGFNIHIIYDFKIPKEFDLINDIKIMKLHSTIKHKKRLINDKHKNDLKYVG